MESLQTDLDKKIRKPIFLNVKFNDENDIITLNQKKPLNSKLSTDCKYRQILRKDNNFFWRSISSGTQNCMKSKVIFNQSWERYSVYFWSQRIVHVGTDSPHECYLSYNFEL